MNLHRVGYMGRWIFDNYHIHKINLKKDIKVLQWKCFVFRSFCFHWRSCSFLFISFGVIRHYPTLWNYYYYKYKKNRMKIKFLTVFFFFVVMMKLWMSIYTENANIKYRIYSIHIHMRLEHLEYCSLCCAWIINTNETTNTTYLCYSLSTHSKHARCIKCKWDQRQSKIRNATKKNCFQR